MKNFTKLFFAVAIMLCGATQATGASTCPSGTIFLWADEDYLYCQRVDDPVGDDSATRAAILRYAMSKLGYPYHQINGRCLNGDISYCPTREHVEGCYDCSALVYDVLRAVGQRPPNTGAANIYEYFRSLRNGLKYRDPIYGDIVFFSEQADGAVTHVAIYLGARRVEEGTLLYYLHAPGKGRPVTVGRRLLRDGNRAKWPIAYGNVSILRFRLAN